MKNSIVDLDSFIEIFKINLLNIPNQNFTTTIKNIPYSISVETSQSLQSYITIKQGNTILCLNGNIKNFVDLTLPYKNGSFFFVLDADKQYIDLNYQNFNKGLNLYYGSF